MCLTTDYNKVQTVNGVTFNEALTMGNHKYCTLLNHKTYMTTDYKKSLNSKGSDIQ